MCAGRDPEARPWATRCRPAAVTTAGTSVPTMTLAEADVAALLETGFHDVHPSANFAEPGSDRTPRSDIFRPWDATKPFRKPTRPRPQIPWPLNRTVRRIQDGSLGP